ncbi:MAG TPA: NDP-sugar synthase [Candidatus Limnocylindria bacterium]|nr:NDP-sugar synthase [Candidatus Limnocylindria bacterium]
MKAMVLAAGQGTRLRPLTDHQPKALVPVAGRPMIEYALLLLRHYGIREVIINLHHLGEHIERHLGDGSNLGLEIRYSTEQELLDTGGGLFKARPFLQRETFLVINTDTLIDLNLAAVIEFHRNTGATATLVLRPDERADQYGSIDIDAEGRICRFLATSARVQASGPTRKLMFTGVQILEPKVFDYMGEDKLGQKFSTTKETYPRMLAGGEALYGYYFDGFWQDLGTHERIKAAEQHLTLGRAGLHYLPPRA